MTPQSPDPRETADSKELRGREGKPATLELKTWISDTIAPRRRVYQLVLVQSNGHLRTQFPTDWERYTESQIREMYGSVNSVEDFDRLREKAK